MNDFLSKHSDGLKSCQHFEPQVQLSKPTPLPIAMIFLLHQNITEPEPCHQESHFLKYIFSCDAERDPSNYFSCFFLSRSHYKVFVLRKFFCCITLLSFKQSKYDDFKFNFLQVNTCCASNICRFLF